MKMIEMLNIALALPKCTFGKPNEAGCQFLFDKNGDRVGHIHWQENEVVIYEGYEHCDAVIKQIEEETGKKFEIVERPDPDEEGRRIVNEMREEGLMPIDITESLYGEP